MQKGKAYPSAMVFQGRPPQQNPRGPPSSQQRPDDFNARQPQAFQLPTQMPQNIVMGQIPGQMQTPQGQPYMPNQQQFYHGQRPMRIPRHQNPNNPPMYASPPGPPMTVQMIGPGPLPFIPPGQNPQLYPQHSLGAKSAISMDLDAITSPKGIMPSDIVEIFRAEYMCNKEQSPKEAQQSSAAASDVKTAVEPGKETAEPAGRGPLIRRKEEQEENLQRQLREMGQQLKEKDEQEENLQRQLREMEKQLREKDKKEKKLQGQLREMEVQVISLQGQCKEKDQESSNLERQLRDHYQDLVEVHKTLSETDRKLEKCKCQEKRDWIIPRDDISITDKSLGRGAWGYVHEGKYCGCTVAVKKLHEKDLISPCNRGKFEREMDIASRCRHPCLLQFIGATNDEESPLFVTELMELSLRQLLNKRPLSDREVVTISLDVARALSYLHKKRPSPILHRDVSSPNVLLWRRGNHWRAKVSDYGTANFLQDTMTANPGTMIYSAPEACARTQTVKIDVYSFGVLLCEMCTREMPEPDRRDAQVQLVKNPVIQALVRRCLQSAAEDRPSMEEIIEDLEQLNGTS